MARSEATSSNLCTVLSLGFLIFGSHNLIGLLWLKTCMKAVNMKLHAAQSLQSIPTLWAPWTVAHQAPLSMGFYRQEYWSGLLCPPPGDLPDPGIKPATLKIYLHWQVGSLPLAPPGKMIIYMAHELFPSGCLFVDFSFAVRQLFGQI